MRNRDLTSGPIPGHILGLAIPMIASSVLHSIQHLVDMYFVGRLGPEAIAGVGLSGTVLMVLAAVFMGINVSTGAMVSRAIGARNTERACSVAGQALLLTVLVSCVVGSVGYLSASAILEKLGAASQVVEIGTSYLRVIFSWIFFMCVLFVFSGVFHGSGDAVTPFLLGLVATGCNIVLTPLLMFGWLGLPEMGIRGAAVATVIARIIAVAVGVRKLTGKRSAVRVRLTHLRPNAPVIWRVLCIGFPSSLQMGARTLMNLVLTAIVAKFGTLVLAGYIVATRIRMLGIFPSLSFGASAAAMVGQNLGAHKPERSKRSAWVAAGMALSVSVIVAVIFVAFAPQLVGIFNKAPAVVSEGSRMLRFTAIGLLTASIGIVLSRAISGAGDTVSPLVITLVMLWGFQIPAAVYLSGVREMWGVKIPFRGLFQSLATNSATGIWYAMVAASVLQAITVVVWFLVGRWKHKKV